jgi:YgiT-type zinc finger domain-containing protein
VAHADEEELPMIKCSMTGCAGEYEPKSVTHTVRYQGEIVVIDHVPAEVCSICGDTLLAPDTVRGLERVLAHRGAPARSAPVYEYDGTEGRAA